MAGSGGQRDGLLGTWRLPRFVTWLWILFALMAMAVAVDFVVCILSPCAWYAVGESWLIEAGLCVEEYLLVLAVRAAAQLIALLVLLAHYFVRLWSILSYQQHNLPQWFRKTALRPRTDFWVGAASPDLFDETVALMKIGNQTTGVLVTPFFLAVLVAELSRTLAWGDGSNRIAIAASDPCQGNLESLCEYAQHICPVLLVMQIMMTIVLNMSVHTTPPLLWSRTMEQAALKTGNHRVKQFMVLPWLGALGYLTSVYCLVHYTRLQISPWGASALEHTWLLIVQVLNMVYLLFLGYWSMILQDTYALLRPQPEAQPLETPNSQFSDGDELEASNPGTQSEPNHQSGWAKRMMNSYLCRHLCGTNLLGIIRSSQAGSVHRKEILLMIAVVLWMSRGISNLPVFCRVIHGASRLIVFILLLRISEPESSFQETGHQGFGLVVGAAALRKAASGGWPDHLPLFKANVYRMQSTLAVSYRWQSTATEVAPGHSLNMSDFQLQALAQVIDVSGAQYVWLDQLSVEQDDTKGDLKSTLLARMMGVYSAAQITVVIRTLELPGSRYHERAWTFQEFCSCSQLHTVTEPELEEEEEGGDLAAVEDEEDREFQWWRQELQGGMVNLTPLWLCDPEEPMSQEVALQVLERYDQLSGKLDCRMMADKIRALCPLLANCPVESQQELVYLVRRIEQASGEDLYHWKAFLFEQHLSTSKFVNYQELRRSIPIARNCQASQLDADLDKGTSSKGIHPRSRVDTSDGQSANHDRRVSSEDGDASGTSIPTSAARASGQDFQSTSMPRGKKLRVLRKTGISERVLADFKRTTAIRFADDAALDDYQPAARATSETILDSPPNAWGWNVESLRRSFGNRPTLPGQVEAAPLQIGQSESHS